MKKKSFVSDTVQFLDRAEKASSCPPLVLHYVTQTHPNTIKECWRTGTIATVLWPTVVINVDAGILVYCP